MSIWWIICTYSILWLEKGSTEFPLHLVLISEEQEKDTYKLIHFALHFFFSKHFQVLKRSVHLYISHCRCGSFNEQISVLTTSTTVLFIFWCLGYMNWKPFIISFIPNSSQCHTFHLSPKTIADCPFKSQM